jgi:hypothetical protein
MHASLVRPEPAKSRASEKLPQLHAEQIRLWLGEEDMAVKQIWRLLRERGVAVVHTSVKRFVRRHVDPPTPRVTIRLEKPPGRQALYDPTVNRAYGELERHYGFV